MVDNVLNSSYSFHSVLNQLGKRNEKNHHKKRRSNPITRAARKRGGQILRLRPFDFLAVCQRRQSARTAQIAAWQRGLASGRAGQVARTGMTHRQVIEFLLNKELSK